MEFDEHTGDFVFSERRDNMYMRLELWEEFSECVKGAKSNDRVWMVDSGEIVRFNDTIELPIPMSKVDEFCEWLNKYLVQDKWKDKQIDVEGKVLFYSNEDHSVVALVMWSEKTRAFVVKTHDFAK